MSFRRFAALVFGLSSSSVTLALVVRSDDAAVPVVPEAVPKPTSWGGFASQLMGAKALKG